MEKREILRLRGDMSASYERREAFVTEFQENDGFINENCYDLLELLEKLDGRKVTILIESEEQ